MLPACAVALSEQTYVSPNNADLAPGASESLLTSIQIPVSTAPGAGYRLLFYADWRRQVSERTEVNNWAASLPFTVIPPQYVMIGPLTPCSATTNPNCTKSTGSSQPLAWQFSYNGVTAVDSATTQPRLKIYQAGSSTPMFQADPTDVASGGSGWQYFNGSCLPVGTSACSRPAYTWQYNWQLKVPGTGTNLPPGDYVVKIEVPATQQTDDPGGKGAVGTITVKVM